MGNVIQTPLAQILGPVRQQQFSPSQYVKPVSLGDIFSQAQNRQAKQQQIDQTRQMEKLQSLAIGANEVLPFLEDDNIEGANKTLDLRRQKLIQQGLPTNDTDNFQKLLGEDPQVALQQARTAIDTANKVGAFGSRGLDPNIGNRVQSSKKFTDGTVQLIMRDGSVKVVNNDGVELTGQAAQRAVEQANQAEVNQRAGIKGGEKRASDNQAKNTEWMNAGLEAADSLANINRSLEILDSVETGGIDQAMLAAKNFLGIESADEGQLSAGLGKAILAQLRPIFGAQFTEKEGARLERIEAGLGKSPAANRRLLEEAKTIALRAARRGIRVAEKIGDDFSAEEIKAAIDFDIKKEREARTQQQPTQPTQQAGGLTPEEQAELDALEKEFGGQ